MLRRILVLALAVVLTAGTIASGPGPGPVPWAAALGVTKVQGWTTAAARTEGLVLLRRVTVVSGARRIRRDVIVQRQPATGGTWRSLSRAHTSSTGVLTARLLAPGAGTWRFRLAVPATRTMAAVRTAARRVTFVLPVQAKATLTGLPSPLPADGRLYASRVRLSDGAVVAALGPLAAGTFTMRTPSQPSLVVVHYVSRSRHLSLVGVGSLFVNGVATTPALTIRLRAQSASAVPAADAAGGATRGHGLVNTATVPAIGLPAGGFTLSGDSGLNAKVIPAMLTHDLVESPCREQDGAYHVVNTDPVVQAARMQEISMCKSAYFDQTTCPQDRTIPMTHTVSGSASLVGEQVTLDLRLRDQQGNEVARTTASGEFLGDVWSRAAKDLTDGMCAARLEVADLTCQPKPAPCPGGSYVTPTMTGSVTGPVGTRLVVNTPPFLGSLSCGSWAVETWQGSLLSCVRTVESLPRQVSFTNVQRTAPLLWCPTMPRWPSTFIATLTSRQDEVRRELSCP